MEKEAANLSLLPQNALIKTGHVDHANWNYKPVLGTISASRFRLIKKLLTEKHVNRLLEIGYGSGVFLPELKRHATDLFGIDIHNKAKEVSDKLAAANVSAELVSSGAETMPWNSNFFDIIVAVSALEFVSDLDAVCQEVIRTLSGDGRFIIVTPSKSAVLDFGLKILTGVSAKKDFANRRELILPTLKKYFNVKQKLTYPEKASSLFTIYTALELTPKN